MVDECRQAVGGDSDRGERYGDLNQDAFFATEYLVSDRRGVVAGVFDGHAPSGELSARSCSDTLEQWSRTLNGDKLDQLASGGFAAVLHRLFDWLHFEACDAVAEAQAECGTTAVVALADAASSKLALGWAGDSVAIMTTLADGRLSHEVVSPAHSTTSPAEIERIRADTELEINDDGYLTHPTSHFLRGYQVKMTRALGHRSFPISCRPDVAVLPIGPQHRCLVLCSDGVTDLLSTDEIGDWTSAELAAGKRPAAVARSLIDRALSKAKHAYQKDNATAVVVDLDCLFPDQQRPPLRPSVVDAVSDAAQESTAVSLTSTSTEIAVVSTSVTTTTTTTHILYYSTLRRT